MKKIFATLVTGMIATGAQAGTVTCSGTITYLAYHAPNNFMIQLSSMNRAVFFCNPETTFTVPGTTYTTGPNACKALYATFLSAKAAGGTIINMYFDGDDVPGTCDTWGDWKSANVRHFAY